MSMAPGTNDLRPFSATHFVVYQHLIEDATVLGTKISLAGFAANIAGKAASE